MFIRRIILVINALLAIVILGMGTTSSRASAIVSARNQSMDFARIMTFDEMTRKIATDNDISIEQATHELVGDDQGIRREAHSKQYRVFKEKFQVSDNYTAELSFYCETTESGLFRGIKRVLRVELTNDSKEVSKQFNGTIYVSLEGPNKLFYIVNGDFYTKGITTYDPKVNVTVEDQASINFKVRSENKNSLYNYTEKRLNF